jgi:NADH-quinone oxidoreductase subunit G
VNVTGESDTRRGKTPAFAEDQPGDIAAREGGETVKLTIDDREVTVPKGTNVLEAARRIGVEISAFCYHPGLPIAAVCRQCLVKVEKAPKPVPACQAVCTDGMVVSTNDADVVDRRRQMLEFTLVNHPIDCPICDKAGECTLQELYFDHNAQMSRVDVPKVRKNKVVDVGPRIVLDQERCILCTRCIRVCDSVAGEHQLDMAFRNDREVLTTAPGELLDNAYSLNTVDVCPVGALTQKDFRFTMRAWELMMTPSICTGCATGCNVEIHHRESRVYRLRPRHNAQVNKHWMCDEGRFTYKELALERLAGPVVDGLPSSWDAALQTAAKALQEALETDRTQVGVVFSAQHSNEDNYVLARLAREFWQVGRLYIAGKPDAPERADDILRDADVNPNRAGVAALLADAAPGGVDELRADLSSGAVRTLLVLGHELGSANSALADAPLANLIVLSDRDTGIARHARVVLSVAAWAEIHGTMTNRQGLVQRLHAAFPPAGQALPGWDALVRLGRATGAALDYSNAKRVFTEMVGTVPTFAEASWGTEAPLIQLRFAHSRG